MGIHIPVRWRLLVNIGPGGVIILTFHDNDIEWQSAWPASSLVFASYLGELFASYLGELVHVLDYYLSLGLPSVAPKYDDKYMVGHDEEI